MVQAQSRSSRSSRSSHRSRSSSSSSSCWPLPLATERAAAVRRAAASTAPLPQQLLHRLPCPRRPRRHPQQQQQQQRQQQRSHWGTPLLETPWETARCRRRRQSPRPCRLLLRQRVQRRTPWTAQCCSPRCSPRPRPAWRRTPGSLQQQQRQRQRQRQPHSLSLRSRGKGRGAAAGRARRQRQWAQRWRPSRAVPRQQRVAAPAAVGQRQSLQRPPCSSARTRRVQRQSRLWAQQLLLLRSPLCPPSPALPLLARPRLQRATPPRSCRASPPPRRPRPRRLPPQLQRRPLWRPSACPSLPSPPSPPWSSALGAAPLPLPQRARTAARALQRRRARAVQRRRSSSSSSSSKCSTSSCCSLASCRTALRARRRWQ